MHGLAVSRLIAYDGSALTVEDVAAVITPTAHAEIAEGLAGSKRKHHAQLSMGGVGCGLSHIAAWKHIAAMQPNLPVIVFEDDIEIPKDTYSLQKINTQWQHAKTRQKKRRKISLAVAVFLNVFVFVKL